MLKKVFSILIAAFTFWGCHKTETTPIKALPEPTKTEIDEAQENAKPDNTEVSKAEEPNVEEPKAEQPESKAEVHADPNLNTQMTVSSKGAKLPEFAYEFDLDQATLDKLSERKLKIVASAYAEIEPKSENLPYEKINKIVGESGDGSILLAEQQIKLAKGQKMAVFDKLVIVRKLYKLIPETEYEDVQIYTRITTVPEDVILCDGKIDGKLSELKGNVFTIKTCKIRD